MSGGALWSGASPATFSADRLTATTTNSSDAWIYVGRKVATGVLVFFIQCNPGSQMYGFCDASVLGTPTAFTCGFQNNGTVWADGSSSVVSIGARSTGDWVAVAIDMGSGTYSTGTKQSWYGTISGGVITWNGNPLYSPPTGAGGTGALGGVAFSAVTNAVPAVFSFGSGLVIPINMGASAYPATVPSSLANWPATLAVGNITATTGGAAQIPWTDSALSGLTGSLDGGSFAALSGVTSGTSGIATGATISDFSIHNYVVRDSTNTIDQTPPIQFMAGTAGGSLLLSTAGTLGENTLTFAMAAASNFEFVFTGDIESSTSIIEISLTNAGFDTSETPPAFQMGFQREFDHSGTVTVQGPAGEGGTASLLGALAGTAITVQGTATLTYVPPDTHISYSISSQGNTASITNAMWAPGEDFLIAGVKVTCGGFSGGTFNNYGVVVRTNPTESLAITAASVTSAGSLQLEGASPTGLLGLNSSTDNGVTFGAPDTFSASGTTWALSDGILSAGIYDCVVQDTSTMLESPAFTLTVTQTLTLDTLSVGAGPVLNVGGKVYYFNTANVDFSINGTWQDSSSFSLTTGGWPEPYVASLASPPTGTLTVQMRDHTNTLVLSNIGTVVVDAETIDLATVTGYATQNGYVTGSVSGGTPTALGVAINGTWTGLLSDFVLSAGNFTGTIAGNPFPTAASYTVQLRDAAAHYVTSNTVTAAIGNQEQILLQSAIEGATTLDLGGVSSFGPPGAIQYTTNAGSLWQSPASYATASGTFGAIWSATCAPLSFGTYQILVRDAADHTVVSNPITLTVGAPEILTLITATPAAAPAATGSLGDMLNRLRGLLPAGWFPRDGLFAGQGGPLNLSGTIAGRVPAGINVTVDGGQTWAPASNYAVSGGVLVGGAPLTWTATGPVVQPGVSEIAVQDAARPDVVSNTLPLTILAGYTSAVDAVVVAILSGPAAVLARLYALVAFVRAQMRLSSSVGGWIDLWAYDYFGYWIRRRPTEQDAPFITRIQQNLLAPLVTRAAMVEALTNLTGEAPTIFEPFNAADAACYGSPQAGYGFCQYGSLLMRAQALIIVNQPASSAAGPIPAYGSPQGGYGAGCMYYFPASQFPGVAQIEEVRATINRTKAAGVICWVAAEG